MSSIIPIYKCHQIPDEFKVQKQQQWRSLNKNFLKTTQYS